MDFNDVVTPEQRMQSLNNAFRQAKPGDTINAPAGVYEADRFPKIPDGVIVSGAGWGKTIFQSPYYFTAECATTFDLGDQCTLQNVELRPTAEKNKQTCVVGMGTTSAAPRSAVLRNVKVTGGVWGAYIWSNPGHKLLIENCDFTVARIGICGGVSNGANAQFITIKDSRIKLDASLSTQGGSVTHHQWGGQAGILMRGGQCTIDGLTVEALGPPAGTGPRCVAVTDWLDLSSATQTVITVRGLRTKLTAGGAKEVFDIDVRYGTLRFDGCCGSGKGGSLAISNLPPLPGKPGGTP